MRKYDEEFKMNSVQFYRSSKKALKAVASELGIPFGTFRTWIRNDALSSSSSFSGNGQASSSQEQLRLLKKELHHVRQERDILKKAVAIFSEPRGKGIAS